MFFSIWGVSENRDFPPKIIYFNRVFHEINHPFWGIPIFGKHPYLENQLLLISINFTPKTSHSCLKKWYSRLSRMLLFNEKKIQTEPHRLVQPTPHPGAPNELELPRRPPASPGDTVFFHREKPWYLEILIPSSRKVVYTWRIIP